MTGVRLLDQNGRPLGIARTGEFPERQRAELPRVQHEAARDDADSGRSGPR